MRQMARKFVFAIAFVLIAGTVAAQTVAPVQSFADLQPLVRSGQELIVWQNDGRKARGRVVSLSGDKLELRQPRFFFRYRHDVYVESATTRIEAPDSTWNGTLIGLGLGLLVSVVVSVTADPQDDDWGDELMYVALSPAGGALIGDAIDGAINRTLFVSPAAKRVTLRPVVRDTGGRVVGATATVRF